MLYSIGPVPNGNRQYYYINDQEKAVEIAETLICATNSHEIDIRKTGDILLTAEDIGSGEEYLESRKLFQMVYTGDGKFQTSIMCVSSHEDSRLLYVKESPYRTDMLGAQVFVRARSIWEAARLAREALKDRQNTLSGRN